MNVQKRKKLENWTNIVPTSHPKLTAKHTKNPWWGNESKEQIMAKVVVALNKNPQSRFTSFAHFHWFRKGKRSRRAITVAGFNSVKPISSSFLSFSFSSPFISIPKGVKRSLLNISLRGNNTLGIHLRRTREVLLTSIEIVVADGEAVNFDVFSALQS